MTTCTVIARNYLAHARVLARSFAAQHDGERIAVLVIDDVEGAIRGSDEPFDVLTPGDLALDRDEFLRMAAIYEITELATALKPWVLQALLDGGTDVAMYLDPDMVVTAPLGALTDAAKASVDGIALTPHRLTPVPQDGRRPAETELLRSGVFNLGFIAVTDAARPFLAWWQSRLRRDCLINPDLGYFVDQRWIDEVPALWQPTIVRDPAYNVAYWNADERSLDGVALLHFSGFDPHVPHLLTRNTADTPRVLLSEHPELAGKAAAYAEALEAAGLETSRKTPYGFALASNGYALDRRSRHRYKEGLQQWTDNGWLEPPSPFSAGEAFVDWLRQVAPGNAARVSRYLVSVWHERPDLKAIYPSLSEPDGFLGWVVEHGAGAGIPSEMVPTPDVLTRPAASLHDLRATSGPTPPGEHGVNVVGYFAAESGVGESARLLVSALRAGRIPHALVGFNETPSRQTDPFGSQASTNSPHDINVICINADELVRFAQGPGKVIFDGRPTVGLWMWEVDVFPPEMADAARYVDEIWVGSEHTAQAVRASVDSRVGVFSFPPPVVALAPAEYARADLDLPDDRFVFLFAFDYLSVFKRKNPFGVVEAFMQAFAPNEGPLLVIKSIHGETDIPQLEALRAAVAHRPDIEIRDGMLSRAAHTSLVHACDAYVSLHRAEGFGLTTAEAMAIGKPVIATAYSGTLENMTANNSWLIPYRLIPVGDGAAPYPPEAHWADPDIDQAAAAMRTVFDDPDAARDRGQRAARDIAEHHGPAARVKFINERLRSLQNVRATAIAAPPPRSIARKVVNRLGSRGR